MSNYRSYTLISGLIKCGSYPFDSDFRVGVKILQRLLQQGVTNFIDLTEPDEQTSKGEQMTRYPFFLRQVSEGMKSNIEYKNIPIAKDFRQINQPCIQKLTTEIIDNNFQNKIKTYIHCRGGLYRTSLVSVILTSRIYQISEHEALDRLSQLQLKSNYSIPKEYMDIKEVIKEYLNKDFDKYFSPIHQITQLSNHPVTK